MRKSVTYKNLSIVIYPTMQGEALWGRIQVDGALLPERWAETDWQRVSIGSKVEFLSREKYLTGTVEDIDLRKGEILLTGAILEGEESDIEIGYLGDWGSYSVRSMDAALVEPHWLMPEGVVLPVSAYREIKNSLRDWEVFRPLTWSEISLCVSLTGASASSRPDVLISLLVEGKFGVHPVVRQAHDAARLAEQVFAAGWPMENVTILEIAFDIDSCRWLWLRPGSLLDDRLGLAQATVSRDEFSQDKLLTKFLNPHFSRWSERLSNEGAGGEE